MFVIKCFCVYSRKNKRLKLKFTAGNLLKKYPKYLKPFSLFCDTESSIPIITYMMILKLYMLARNTRTYSILIKIKYTNNDIYVKLLNSKDEYYDQLVNYLQYYHDYKLEYIKVEKKDLKWMKQKWLS